MRILATLALLLMSLSTFAAPVTLSCTLPTLNDDGTPLTDLAGVRFYESLTTGGPYTLIGDEVACGFVTPDRAAGTYYYVATAYNVPGVESAYSNEAVKVVPPLAPAPPINLVVDPANLVAYAVSQTKDVMVLYPVGTVPNGTACDGSMQFNDKYVVPMDSVNWAGTARPLVIFASCGAG